MPDGRVENLPEVQVSIPGRMDDLARRARARGRIALSFSYFSPSCLSGCLVDEGCEDDRVTGLGYSLDGVTVLYPTVGTRRRSQGVGAAPVVSASHLAHLIVLPGLSAVPLGLGLRLPLGLGLRLPLGLPLPGVLVGVGVLGLVLHLGAGLLLGTPSLQGAWSGGRGC